MTIPEFISGNEVFQLYKDYVLKTGLSDFPVHFGLAGSFKSDDYHEINMLSNYSNWLFENKPLAKTEKAYNILKRRRFSSFRSNYIFGNYFFTKEFYAHLLKEIKTYFDQTAGGSKETGTIYDKYYFLFKNYHINICSANLAWLNDYRTFYAPGMLHSLTIKNLYQRSINKKLAKESCLLHLSFAEESKSYPKPNEDDYRFPDSKNMNKLYFPLIVKEVGSMIEKVEDEPYFDFISLQKLYKKAKKGNKTAVEMLLKWVTFEIWREYIA